MICMNPLGTSSEQKLQHLWPPLWILLSTLLALSKIQVCIICPKPRTYFMANLFSKTCFTSLKQYHISLTSLTQVRNTTDVYSGNNTICQWDTMLWTLKEVVQQMFHHDSHSTCCYGSDEPKFTKELMPSGITFWRPLL